MSDDLSLSERFTAQRARLKAVAFRMLGSQSEAEDAVQETWLRMSRADTSAVESLGAWLTSVIARVCLDVLRARKTRAEVPWATEGEGGDGERGAGHAEDGLAAAGAVPAPDAEHETLLADALGPALMVVLDTLVPAERLAFVLHDLFGVPFDEVATILARSPAAVRQLASRARRRVQGVRSAREVAPAREIVGAFLSASRDGNFDRLVAVLDPQVVLRVDPAAVRAAAAAVARGAPPLPDEAHGAEAVARTFVGRARAAQLALIDGAPGAVWAPRGLPLAAFIFRIADGRIVELEIVNDRERIGTMDVTILEPATTT